MTTIPQTTTGVGGVPMSTGPAGMMDQSDFLRLMTTQLTTQDPFNPMDNTQMVAQMAQFSQVAGIAEMNKSLSTIAAGLAPGRLADAASWIGRAMLTQSEFATPLPDGAYGGEISLPRDAEEVTLSFVDENGQIVHSEELGAQAKGELSFAWNGKDSEGNVKASGPLRLVVNARAGGQTINATTSAWTSIGGIQSPASGGTTKLVTGLGLLTPDQAIRLA